jgi:hypothetical protein
MRKYVKFGNYVSGHLIRFSNKSFTKLGFYGFRTYTGVGGLSELPAARDIDAGLVRNG